MNIRNNHIFELRIKIELYEDHRSEGVSTYALGLIFVVNIKFPRATYHTIVP